MCEDQVAVEIIAADTAAIIGAGPIGQLGWRGQQFVRVRLERACPRQQFRFTFVQRLTQRGIVSGRRRSGTDNENERDRGVLQEGRQCAAKLGDVPLQSDSLDWRRLRFFGVN